MSNPTIYILVHHMVLFFVVKVKKEMGLKFLKPTKQSMDFFPLADLNYYPQHYSTIICIYDGSLCSIYNSLQQLFVM